VDANGTEQQAVSMRNRNISTERVVSSLQFQPWEWKQQVPLPTRRHGVSVYCTVPKSNLSLPWRARSNAHKHSL